MQYFRSAGWLRLATALFALNLVACSDGDESANQPTEPNDIPEGCNPLAADWDCLLPYPSDYFLVDGQVTLSDSARIQGVVEDANIDFLRVHPAGGYSPGSQLLALFPGGVDEEPLVFNTDDVELSRTAESPTLILDADTGEAVLHFAELDPRAEDDARRALAIRPMEPLKYGHRYVVALHGLVDKNGAPVEAPVGFGRIRDGNAQRHPVLGPIQKHFESDVFPVIEQAGVSRDSLVLAWDFTVRTEDDAVGELFEVTANAIETFDKAEPSLKIIATTPNFNDHVALKIDAEITVPLYLEKNAPMARLHRDADGNVVANGTTQVPFSVLIPPSVANRPAGSPPARLMQYGHGFFGSRDEANDLPAEVADKLGFVVIATDWIGMSSEDRVPVISRLTVAPAGQKQANADETLMFADRVYQAMVNQIGIARVAKGALANAPELSTAAGPAYDPSAVYFWGNSMGHILGGTYLALAPDVERGALGVGGANFSFIMFRAGPFAPFLFFIDIRVPDPVEQQKFAALSQLSFDRFDPLSVAGRVLTDTLPGSPAERKLLMQIGVGDNAVPNLSSHLHARALGIPLLEPAVRPVPGLSTTTAPAQSALAEFDFGVEEPLPGTFAVPVTEDTGVHEGVRRLDATQAQLDAFFAPNGSIPYTCQDICDPE